MRTRFPAIACLLGILGAAGCATLRPEAGFAEVGQLVSERTPSRISWDRDPSARAASQQVVKELLRDELTIEEAVQIALLNNRNLQATYGRLGIAEADLVQAGLPPNPILHAGWRFGVGGPPSAELSLLQDFISMLQIPLRKRLAAAQFEAAKLEVAEAVVNMATDVKAAFYTLQGAEQMRELRATVARATALAADVAERQHAAGNITDLDLASERALAEQARLDVARAEEDVLTGREDVNTLLGLWGEDTTWTIARRLPDLPAREVPRRGLESLAVTRRLDLAAARQEAEVQARTLGLTRLYGLIPSGDVGVDAELEDGSWGVGPAIELQIPIFDQRQAAIASDSAKLRQSVERYAAVAVQVRSQVRRARTRMEATRARAEHYAEVLLPLRRRVVEQTQLEYNGMLVGVYQLLQAKRDEIEAGSGFVETLTEYWLARTELERAVGGDLPLEPPGEPPALDGGHHHEE